MKVTVDRQKWYRGQGGINSCLLRKQDGKLCCIGFLAQTLGLRDTAITEVCCLNGVADTERAGIAFHANYATYLNIAYTLNDDRNIADDVREEQLVSIGKEMGVEFEFVGKA